MLDLHQHLQLHTTLPPLWRTTPVEGVPENAVQARLLRRSRDRGLQMRATVSTDERAAQMAVFIQRHDHPDRPDAVLTADSLVACLDEGDRRTATHVRPVQRPSVVTHSLGPAVHRAAIVRGPHVTLVDRWLIGHGPLLVIAEFSSPSLRHHQSILATFARIAGTINVTPRPLDVAA